MLYNLCVLDAAGNLLLSYYFTPATLEEQDAWEADLAAATKPLWEPSFASDATTVCRERYVLVHGVPGAEMVFILSGVDEHDELAREWLDGLVQVALRAGARLVRDRLPVPGTHALTRAATLPISLTLSSPPRFFASIRDDGPRGGGRDGHVRRPAHQGAARRLPRQGRRLPPRNVLQCAYSARVCLRAS
jgi:hypothetical protein